MEESISEPVPPIFLSPENGEEELSSSPTLESKHGVMVEIPVETYITTPEAMRPAPGSASAKTKTKKKKKTGNSEGPLSAGLRNWMPPPEWRIERRARTNGSWAGVIDTFYYHPTSGRQFRSKKEVFNHLNGIDPKRFRGKAKNDTKDNNLPLESSNSKNEESETINIVPLESSHSKNEESETINVVPLESSDLKNKETEAQNMPSSSLKENKKRKSAMDFNFRTPPKAVRYVPTNPAAGPWSPFVGVDMVPQSVKREWAAAFASLSSNNGQKIPPERPIGNDILALIKYEEKTIGLRIGMDSNINELRQVICDKWPNLTPLSFKLSFVRDNKRTSIETDAELQSYACFGMAKRQESVEISLTSDSCSKDVPCVSEEASSSTSLSVGSCVDLGNADMRRPLKSDAWANLITGVGQKFEGGAAEFRTNLLKYCCETGFKVKLVKNDTMRVTAVCGKRQETGCQWRIHASRKFNLPNIFVIKVMEVQHTCGAGTKEIENPAMSSKLVKSIILDQVRERPALKPKEIIDCFRRDYGVNLNYYYAHAGKELAVKEIHGDDALSYHQLLWYTNAMRESNPGSHIVLESNAETRKFERVFIAFEACIHGFNYCRPMLCLYATSLKGKGCLLTATSKNANEDLFPLAMAIVNAESEDNWLWFLENLKLVVSDSRRLTFISDRNWGLAASVPKVFPNSYHGYCLYHLKNDLKTSISSQNLKRSFIVSTFSDCANAVTHHAFQEALLVFKEIGGKAADDFLSTIPYERWANAYFQGSRYGEMASNIAGSFNSWVLERCYLPITSLLDEILLKLRKMICDGREIASQWGTTLCPVVENKLVEKVDAGHTWSVTKSSEYVFEVYAEKTYRVDLKSMCCSCNLWHIEGFPCEHAVRSILFSGQQAHTFCDEYFSVSSFRQSYARSIEPLANSERPREVGDEAAIVPPDLKRSIGRPRNKMKEKVKEKTEEAPKKEIMCSKCKSYGHHNRSTCTQKIQEID